MTLVGVTGGTGFVGKRLVAELLSNGVDVRVLTRNPEKLQQIWQFNNLEPWRGDLTHPDSLQGFVSHASTIYHLAGEIRDPRKMQSTHVAGTQNLCAAAAGAIKHWVQLSSVGVYGFVREGTVTEDTPLAPKNLYETTKAESDRVVIEWARKGSFNFSILRPSIVYGVDMPNQSLFELINMIAKGVFFFIGPKGASVNYIHIDNVIEALMRCAEYPAAKGKIYNLSDNCTIEELVTIIADQLQRSLPHLRLPETPLRWLATALSLFPKFPLTDSRIDALTNRSKYSIERIQNELGYVHRIPMDRGMRQMVNAWKQKIG